MGGQNKVFGSKKQIFPGSAQKCPVSLDFDLNLCSSGWVAKIKFLVQSKKLSFPGSAQKCSESIDFDVNFTNSGWVAKIQFLGAKSRFSKDQPKSHQNR